MYGAALIITACGVYTPLHKVLGLTITDKRIDLYVHVHTWFCSKTFIISIYAHKRRKVLRNSHSVKTISYNAMFP